MTIITQKVKDSFRESTRTFLAYNYHTFNEVASVNDLALEGLLSKALSTEYSSTLWTKGSHQSWDISIPELNNYKIQVKGSLIDGRKVHISSFRLGGYAHNSSFKEGILKYVNENDVWHVVLRKVSKNKENIKIWFYECDKKSFIYDPLSYSFPTSDIPQTKTMTVISNNIKVSIKPSTSHQLWYETDFSVFQTSKGINLIDEFEIRMNDLPKTLLL
jgi:hypothetical protein